MFDVINLDDVLKGVESAQTDSAGQVKNCRLGVFGSRSLVDDRVLELIDKYVNELQARLIVTAAEPAGVCQLAQRYCREKKVPLQIHFLQADKYARGMWEHRSDHVIENSDIVLLIHDGMSRGTHNEMLRTMKFEKPYIYERIPVKPNK